MEIQKSILNTLKYSSVFNYPLTKKEIYKYLIGENKVSYKTLGDRLSILVQNKKIYKHKTVYFLNEINVDYYQKKIKSFREYKNIKSSAKYDLSLLSKLFFIKFIGLTGSVAAKDLRGDYDVDLFFICQKNYVWITRFIVVIYLKYKKLYKNPYCANIYTSLDALVWGDKNVYIANEVARIKTLFNKDCAKEIFLQKNKWVCNYLPNFEYYIPTCNLQKRKYFSSIFIFPLELFLYFLQYLYMKPKISIERISLKRILFLKTDYKDKILNGFYKA